MANAAAIVNAQIPVRFIAVVPRELTNEARSRLAASIRIVNDCAKELLLASDAAIVKTGTGTLEAVAADTPQVTVYDVSRVVRTEWLLLWSWRWIPFIAMPNIILQRQVVPELVGLNCNPKKIAQTLTRILKDEPVRDQMRRDYKAVRQALGSELPRRPTERAAEIVEEILCEAAVPVKSE
jgi:lipid-A-disaccharide synthase